MQRSQFFFGGLLADQLLNRTKDVKLDMYYYGLWLDLYFTITLFPTKIQNDVIFFPILPPFLTILAKKDKVHPSFP